MLKKILFTLLTTLILYNIAVIGYRIYEPDHTIAAVENESGIEYDSLKDYILSGGNSSMHYLFFYSSHNADCIYVKDTVMSTVTSDTQLQIDRIIETVNITDLEDKMETNKLSAEWSITQYPAFAAVHVEKDEIIVDNTLEWNPDMPFTAANIEEWLSLNGLYQYDVQPTGAEENN